MIFNIRKNFIQKKSKKIPPKCMHYDFFTYIINMRFTRDGAQKKLIDYGRFTKGRTRDRNPRGTELEKKWLTTRAALITDSLLHQYSIWNEGRIQETVDRSLVVRIFLRKWDSVFCLLTSVFYFLTNPPGVDNKVNGTWDLY